MMDNTTAIIAMAQEQATDDLAIDDSADVKQAQNGCWVAAWVWVPNVYVVDE
jgi:hypothetical protein